MPKVVKSPKTATRIQKDSDAKRGVKLKAFKLHIDDIAMIENAAKRLNIPQNQMIVQAVRLFVETYEKERPLALP